MNRFLAALSPSLRAEVEQALREEGGQARLERFAGRYIDQDGRWPTNPATAEFIARQYVRESAIWTSARYASSGLASTTVAGMAGGALSIGAGKAGVVVGSRLMQNYWKEVLQYSTGINPRVSGAIYRMAQNITSDTSWREIARDLVNDPSSFDRVLGSRIASALERELLGPLAQVAWRGARSALNHTDPARRISDFSGENDWIDSYVERFAQNQKVLTERTVRQVINEALSQGKSNFQIAEDLQRLWKLTPQHAAAVENYRRGLVSQQKRMGEIRRLTNSYADRLFRSRVKTLTDTEVSAVFNLGREAQWLAAMNAGDMPLNTVKMWVTAQDELVCPVCRPLDGTTATLGSSFEGVGVLVPPVHPNCRCIVVPVEDKTVADFSRSKQKLIFPAQESVSKRTITIEGYEREDGTSVRRHLRRVASTQNDADAAAWLNSLTDETVSKDELVDRFGQEYGENLYQGVISWAESFKKVSHLREMLEGKVEPGSVRRLRAEDEGLLTLASAAQAAPPNAPKLYRGMMIKAPIDDVEKMFRPGQVLDSKVASFSSSKEIADSYSGSQALNMFRFGRKSVSMVLEPGARALNIEPVSRNLPSILGDLDEWVVADHLEVSKVTRTDDNSIEVRLKPSEAVSKASAPEMVSALLEFPFYALHRAKISKHLIGRHDQKTHGRRDHDGIGFELSRSGEGLSSDEMTTLFTTAGIASAVLFRQAAPLATVKSLANPVQTLKRNGQYLKGMASWVTDGSKQFRIFLEGHRIHPEHTRMFTAFADGLDQLAKRPTQMVLHRGMTIPKTQPKRPSIESFTLSADQLRPGHTFDMAPSSFTRSKGIASSFTETGSMKHGTERVVLHVDRGSNSARIADVSPMPWEREYIGWGTYRIDRVVTNAKGVRDVYVTQTQTYSLGHLARNPPPITKKPRPTASPKKTAAKLDEDLGALEVSMEQLLASMGKPSYLP